MSKKPSPTPDSEVFLLSFIGEAVQILTDFTLTTSTANEDSLTPLIVEGYLLDSDENYVYIGSTPDQVYQAVKKDRIVFIQVLDKRDALSDIMDSLNMKSKKEMN